MGRSSTTATEVAAPGVWHSDNSVLLLLGINRNFRRAQGALQTAIGVECRWHWI
jgi:hypothetical protein